MAHDALARSGASPFEADGRRPEATDQSWGRWAAARSRLHELTRREYEIFQMVGCGLDNRRIAASLGIEQRTVKLHLSSIFRKLGLESRLQVGVAAAEHALIGDRPEPAGGAHMVNRRT
jgi:DNA-binding NarL/FixJ family response regulator